MYSEVAIQNFYEWEIRGRGYFLYPYSVSIEPPFTRFHHYSVNSDKYIDDGRVPTILERLFPKKEKVIEPQFNEEDQAEYFDYNQPLRQLKLSFSKIPDFEESLIFEFLNMLSDSNDRISFELIANHQNLNIQIVCNPQDSRRIEHLIKEYFHETIIKVEDLQNLPFDDANDVLLVDFGYNEEFMRPLNSSLNGLVGVMSVINHLRDGEVVMLQVIFKGVENSWAESILQSVRIGKDCFFSDSPEMLTCAKEKISTPLFSVVLRLAVQSTNSHEAEGLAFELIQNIKTISKSEFNSLIPLSNSEYDYDSHFYNVKIRGTNRIGMIMNIKELSSFVYFPSTFKLVSTDRKTKAAPEALLNNKYFLGNNNHLGVERKVTLNDSQRLRHCHIIGATGTGKSTLITNLFLEDIKHGNGCVIFDPHGDTIDDIIPRIPENRLNDVILINPSDYEYSFKINLLSAKTEVEKIVLSSDLVEAFRRHSTSWGDQMTSVLSNAINTFLESSVGGTLLDLKRFLIENSFRKEFLKTVNDSSIHYYWDNEFILLKKLSISPLLTRLDTFLRPKLIRNMLSENEGLDFNEVISKKKILLVKLSQGLIGEENSYLLGTLILSKIYQVAQARQSLPQNERHPFYIYLDEFHNFITPSINGILSGARKYGVGLVLAHQELNQIKDSDVYNSILSNANIQICFRLGDPDAKKLESRFSGFDSGDLQNLNIGEAIAKVLRNTEDFSLNSVQLHEFSENENRNIIIKNSREKYSKIISDFKETSITLLENIEKPELIEIEDSKFEDISINCNDIEEKSKEYIEVLTGKEEVREHRYLQTFIKKIAEQRGFKASIEETIAGGRIDVLLMKSELKIACEIAVSNSVEYEVKNVLKCISVGHDIICVISKDNIHLERIRKKVLNEIKGDYQIKFFMPHQIADYLGSLENNNEKIERIKGYRVRVNYYGIDE